MVCTEFTVYCRCVIVQGCCALKESSLLQAETFTFSADPAGKSIGEKAVKGIVTAVLPAGFTLFVTPLVTRGTIFIHFCFDTKGI